ncbi:MAG: hypothetical protein H0W99_16280 [Acidobacteria bacterium]|nr:hypothetical protein [Acidobacteriota bacterium]
MLDNQLNRLAPTDVLAGDPQAAVKSIKGARALWSRMSKGEVIEDAMKRAGVRAGQFTGSGYENGLRKEFRDISLNKKRMNSFNKEEQAAIRKVAMGGPVDNIMRQFGKFAPTGVVSTAVSTGLGFTLGGGIGAVALPAAGFAARRGATNMTIANAERAGQIARMGGKPRQGRLTEAERRKLAAAMSSGIPLGSQIEGLLR